MKMEDENSLRRYRLDKVREMIEIKFCPVKSTTGAKELLTRLTDFVKDSDAFYSYQHPSLSTIQRYWGLTDKENKYKLEGREEYWTLLVRILGYKSWEDFTNSVDYTFSLTSCNDKYRYFCNVDNIQRLAYGDKITIGFPPYKYCVLRYYGDMEFEVLYATQDMRHKEGDTVYAERFVLDRAELDEVGAPMIFYKRFLFIYECDEDYNLIDPSLGELQIL